jgi:hypothetical protein
MSRKLCSLVLVCLLFVATVSPVLAVEGEKIKNLAIYDAGVATVLEERTVELQTGLNTIEWRSLLPKAYIRTVRVVAENADVVRQDVANDGADVRSEKSPTLRLAIQNKGAAGARKVQVSYLVPNMRWQNDYSLVLDQTAEGVSPTAATFDSWVSIFNSVGTDVAAETLDLIAGDIALLDRESSYREEEYGRQQYRAQTNVYASTETSDSSTSAAVEGLSIFSRFRLGQNISLPSSIAVNRFPLFQRARLGIIQRNVFENAYNQQTLARNGFTLLPRGLEVRIVSKNTTNVVMPNGRVNLYAMKDGIAQLVGQDQIPLTPVDSEFTVVQGRSGTLFGTRRVVERSSSSYKAEDGYTRDKLTTKIEIALINRGKIPAEAFVREGIEAHGYNRWTILESSTQHEKIGAGAIQMKVTVPANGQMVVSYTVETK